MALKSKHPHIRIDQQIWDDPVMIGLSDRGFKIYVFAIAWSKSQGGRTPDGLLTEHGIGRIGATAEILEELQNNKLIEKCSEGYNILKYSDWQVTSREERDEAQRVDEKREIGKQSAAKRWGRPTPASTSEDGFDAEKAFESAWAEWPEDGYHEKRQEALESFCTNITNSKDWTAFQSALMKRLKDYNSENKPKPERRKFLGAFKNFCAPERWSSWLPKSFRSDGSAPVPLAIPASPSLVTSPQSDGGPPVSKFPPRTHGLPVDVTDEELLSYLDPKPAA